ncbi:MAG: HXXEE domain-containing protein [Gemmatimonadetes bacterium]|nr:HXXEE domain-containing protein [Gemmatimonadota bacterium]
MSDAPASDAPRGGPSRRAALLLVPVLLTVHNAEEALFVPRALRTVLHRVPVQFTNFVPTARQVYVGLLLATVVPWLSWLAGAARRETRAGIAALLLIQCVVLANVAWHVGAAFWLHGYAPGLATALVLNLPFSIWLLQRAWRERWIRRPMLAGFLPLAVLLHGPVVFALTWLAR